MSHSLSNALSLAVLLALPTSADVLVVDDEAGPGVDYTNLATAVAAAADGDVLLLKSGDYYPETIAAGTHLLTIDGKSLDIVSDVSPGVGSAARLHLFALVVTGLDADQLVTVRGVEFTTATLRAEDNAGTVIVEDCAFPAFATPDPAVGALRIVTVEDCAGVHFTRCEIRGEKSLTGDLLAAGNALWIVSADVSLTDSLIAGGQGGFGVPAGFGVSIDGGTFFASGSEIRGGWGADSIQGCGPGGPALISGPTAEVWLRDTHLDGGDLGDFCDPPTPPGFDLVGLANHLDGAARVFQFSGPTHAGVPLVGVLEGEPGDFAFLLLSSGASWVDLVAEFGGVLGVDSTLARVYPLGSLPFGALFQQFQPVPPNPATSGVEVLALTAQALFLDSNGQLLLSGPSRAHILAAGL